MRSSLLTLVQRLENSRTYFVVPAKAGTQCLAITTLDSRLRGNDGEGMSMFRNIQVGTLGGG